MKRSLLVIALGIVLSILTSPEAWAQNAQIMTVIKDPSGAVMPGVTVSAKNQTTGLLRTEVTDAGGVCRLVALPPGVYTVVAEIQGFGTETRPSVTLGIDQTSTLDLTLKPANVSETITVTSDAPFVDVSRSDVATSLSTSQIQNLPVAARRWIDMAMLTPGASQDSIRGQYYRGNVSIGAGVTNFFSTGNVVDGVINTWTEQGEPRQNFPMDGIQEFNVSTSSYKAEYGLATGGVVNVVTKSGSNTRQFGAFLFGRSADLTEKQYFQAVNPPYSRWQYGGTVGGPIITDKLHYFFTYEGTNENVYNTVTVPAWPQYNGTYQSEQKRWTYLGRVDDQLSRNQSLFFRYAQEYEYRPELTVGGSTVPSASLDFAVPRTSVVAGHTWVVNSRALNEIRFQYAYAKYEVAPPGSHGSWDPGYFGSDRLNYCQAVFSYPSVTVGGCGTSQMGPEHRVEFKDSFTYQLPDWFGRHQLKFGGDYNDVPFETDSLGSPLGSWTFPLDRPYDVNSPNTYPTQYTQSLPTYDNLPSKYFNVFVQDDWTPFRSLTLNLGLRYDRQLGAYGDYLNKDLALTADLLGPSAGTFPLAVPYIDTSARGQKYNFGPRAGFAWDPKGDGSLNVHGAAGIYYDNMRTLQLGSEITWPQSQTIVITRPSYPDPFNGLSRTAFLSTAPPNINVLANNLQSPYSHSYNVGAVQAMPFNLAVTADYTYVNRFADTNSVNINLPNQVTGIRPAPQFGRVTQLQSVGESTYRALFLKVDKRMSHKWSALVSYTLAHAKDQPFANDQASVYGYSAENGDSLADRRNKLVVSSTLQLPFSMQVSAILDVRSAVPFNPASSVDVNKDGYAIDVPPGVDFRSGCRDLDLTAINAFRAGYSLAPVTSVACSNYQDIDLRFSKFLSFQSHRIELIAQLFNITNHANFSSPVTNPLSASFGQVNSLLSYINAPSRQAELAIRYQF